jgi:hypothetical protein
MEELPHLPHPHLRKPFKLAALETAIDEALGAPTKRLPVP